VIGLLEDGRREVGGQVRMAGSESSPGGEGVAIGQQGLGVGQRCGRGRGDQPVGTGVHAPIVPWSRSAWLALNLTEC
jgi:hypothetical protein